MTGRRLTDRIKELCAKALDRMEPGWDSTLTELQYAIQEHTLRLSNMSVAASVAGQVPIERRKTPDPNPLSQGIRALFALHTHTQKKPSHYGRRSRVGLEPSSQTGSRD